MLRRATVGGLLAALAFAAPAPAFPGQPDPGFGDGGYKELHLGDPSIQDLATSVAVTPDGHVVVGGIRDAFAFSGQWTLVRLDAQGTPDPDFGDDGIAAVGPVGFLADVALDGDGVIAAGTACDESGNCDGAVARYRSDGSLDPGFGTDGVLTVPDPCADEDGRLGLIRRMAPGWIVLGSIPRSPCDTEEYNELLARITPGGELDHSFSDAGLQADNLGGALTVVTGPKIVVVRNDKLARLTATGITDASYPGTDPQASVAALLALPDGRVAVAGGRDDWPGIAMTLGGGGLDAGFGAFGWARAAPFTYGVVDLARQRDGELVTSGRSSEEIQAKCGSKAQWLLSRFSANGVRDTNFGFLGNAVATIGGYCFTGPDLATGPGDRLVLAGTTSYGERSDFIVVAIDGRPASDFPDSDGDGVPDYNDACPTLAGDGARGGCPGTAVVGGGPPLSGPPAFLTQHPSSPPPHTTRR